MCIYYKNTVFNVNVKVPRQLFYERTLFNFFQKSIKNILKLYNTVHYKQCFDFKRENIKLFQTGILA